jgi:nicotinamidase-related amidase
MKQTTKLALTLLTGFALGGGAIGELKAQGNKPPAYVVAEVEVTDPAGFRQYVAKQSTSRFAMELGYHVTLVRDATAAFSHEFMHAAHDLNGPTFAHAVLTTPELLAAFSTAAS